jgi:hypothetical protein
MKTILDFMKIAMTALLLIFCCIPVFAAEDDKAPPSMSPEAQPAEHDSSLFRPDPSYEEKPYDPEAQLLIYGGKRRVPTPRPLFELGRRLYWDGPIPPTGTLFGKKNRNAFWFMAFGDWRVAAGYNNHDNAGNERGILAAAINLDFDMRLTATERLHAKLTPIDDDGQFTRIDFIPGEDADGSFEGDPVLDNLFFEGDFGPIFSGLTGKDNSLDLPFSFGIIPLLTQNGIWMDDAFTGFAITPLSARSYKLGISNFDLTFFGAFDRVSTKAFKNVARQMSSEDTTQLYGVFGFAEANQGYWEFGYAYVNSDFDGGSYHNVTVSHTRRIRHRLSNSIRLIGNFGQEGILIDPATGGREKTANGALLLIENSLITSKPSTLVPYFNFFLGYERPQSVARAAVAGDILKNTGLNFEADALTGFGNLDANANNTFGGAIGVEYLFNLDQQIVVEGAVVVPYNDEEDRQVQENQYGIGVRWQKPFRRAWIVRADVVKGWIQDREQDLFGVRLELRRKF